jgi:molybdopterin/thiamine biosynthesis adenylyltransferase
MASDEEAEDEQINTESGKGPNTGEGKAIDVEDEAVKDRWSRYIGAMGVEAVAKQSAANIFLSGAGALGIEIAKNLVLAGCKSFTLHDYKPITYRDLSGQFFLNLEEDILNEKKKKATRGEACLHRLKQLNYYVKCTLAPITPFPKVMESLSEAPWTLTMYDVIILTECTNGEIILIDNFCRKHSPRTKVIVADAVGVFTRVINDFGDKFEVLDKNGEDLQDVMIKNIEWDSDEALVELLPNAKHKFEDGDEVLLMQVEGMKLKEGEKHDDPAFKSESISDTIHKVKVITPYAFKIGSTKKFEKYIRNGIARQLKTKKVMTFKPLEEILEKASIQDVPLDGNLAVADFEKMQNN